MVSLGFPNSWQSASSVGNRTAGAVQKGSGTRLGFPRSWQSATSVGYLSAGAVQKSGDATLTLGLGSFTLTGQSVSLLAQRLLTLTAGSFTLTGQAINFLAQRVLALGQGSFALNGQSVALTTALDSLARDLAWIKLIVDADEIHDGNADTITKLQAGTSTSLLVKSFSGVPLSNLTLTHVSSGDDTYSGSTSIGTLAAMAAAIRAIIEADESQTGSTLVKYTKATVTPILTKTVTGTPLVDLHAVQ